MQQVELSFKTGEVILVYGDMDEDGFFMGELDGVRGLVPSNFLTEAPEQYNNQTAGVGTSGLNAQRGGTANAAQAAAQRNNRVPGLGARGPPPPPRDNIAGGAANKLMVSNTSSIFQTNKKISDCDAAGD